MKIYQCLYCNKENIFGYSKRNKYCDNVCQGKHKWITETVPRIEQGTRADPVTLKKYLAEKRGMVCEECGIENQYNNKPLVLQLDHIDGNSDDNHPNNIRLLCPNCHSQTDTYAAKGQGVRYHKKNSRRNRYLQEYKGG
jgi:Zn finger protein HypA/HybF involved in hydrogenase expression